MNSNLSSIDKKYQNDMVLCVTEQSLNETFRRKLDQNSLKLNVYVFIYRDKEGNIQYFMLDTAMNPENKTMPDLPEELKTAIENSLGEETGLTSQMLLESMEKLCLFSYDKYGKKSDDFNENAKIAYEHYFLENAYHFESPDLEALGDDKIIELKNGIEADKCSAIYTQCFKEVEIIVMSSDSRFGYSVNSYSQIQMQKKWKISYESYLYHKLVEYNYCDEDIKKQIEENFNINEENIDNMFEISRLIMDMSTLCVSHSFDLDGLSEKNEFWLMNALDKFVSVYMRCTSAIGDAELKTENDNVKFETDEYLIVSKSQENEENCNYLFKPTKYCYCVSENNYENNDGVKTLNYVLSTQDTKDNFIPKDYEWNWITQDESTKKSGIVSVKRDIIFDKFNSRFKDNLLRLLRKKVTPRLWEDGHCFKKVNIDFNIEDDNSEDKSQFKFESDRDGNFKYIYPEYTVSGYDDWTEFAIVVINTKCWSKYSFSAFSYKEELIDNDGSKYPAIIFEVPVKCSLKVEVNRATDSNDYSDLQDVYDCVIKCILGIKVNMYGKIEIVKKCERNEKQFSELDLDFWGELSSLGTYGDVPGKIQQELSNEVENFVDYFINKFDTANLGTVGWMIGKNTFTYKDEQFSDTGDFMVGINYV